MSSRISQKAVGSQILPYIRIGGRATFSPHITAHIQTDGSYGSYLGPRIAAIIRPATARHTFRYVKPILAVSSTETEWASVAFGVEKAMDLDQAALTVENDNLSVIYGLLNPLASLRHEYARYYRSVIMDLAKKTEWTGVRWIPRGINRADDLFR
jgi:hypothetical protein